MIHCTMKKVFLTLCAAFIAASSYACTSFLVGKKATTDGSTFISYNADDYGMYGHLIYLPHAKHPKEIPTVTWARSRKYPRRMQFKVTSTNIK